MKLLRLDLHDDVEIYTTYAYDKNINCNMSYNGNDDEAVYRHRRELAQLLNTDFSYMVATLQQHTTNFIEVDLKDGGKGIESKDTAIIGYDAMYTREKDLWLFSFHADCTPVLLYCKDQKIVAEVHSGWKGTVNEIAGKLVKHLIDNENCNPEEMYAYIGPAIEYRNFEAKDDIIQLVNKMSFDTSSFYTLKDDGAYLLNSKGLIRQTLLNLGIKEEHIKVSTYCTMEDDEKFFSYRKTKTNDRNITLIRLKGELI